MKHRQEIVTAYKTYAILLPEAKGFLRYLGTDWKETYEHGPVINRTQRNYPIQPDKVFQIKEFTNTCMKFLDHQKREMPLKPYVNNKHSRKTQNDKVLS